MAFSIKTAVTILFLITMTIIGGIWYAYNEGIIIINLHIAQNGKDTAKITEEPIKLFLWKEGKWHQETQNIFYHTQSPSKKIEQITKQYLRMSKEYQLSIPKTELEAIITSTAEIFLSFSHDPFFLHNGIDENFFWIEGLLKSFRENNISIKNVGFLVKNHPLHDRHLNFSKSWPLKSFLLQHKSLSAPTVPTQLKKPYTIIISPASPSARTIDDTYEHTITVEYAELLKKTIQSAAPHISIIIMHQKEMLTEVENVSCINRLQPSLYISLHMNHRKEASSINIYYFTNHHDGLYTLKKTYQKLSFIPYYKAHEASAPISQQISFFLEHMIREHNIIKVGLVMGIPIQSLIGITAPAIALEFNGEDIRSWKQFIPYLAQDICNLFHE